MTIATGAQPVMERLPGLIAHLSHQSRTLPAPRRNTSELEAIKMHSVQWIADKSRESLRMLDSQWMPPVC
jgi:hypothetical protein